MNDNMGKTIPKGKEIGQAIKEISDKYGWFQEYIPGMFFLFARHPDGSYSFPYVNNSSRKLFDIEPEDLMRDWTLLSRLIHPNDQARFFESVKISAETFQPLKEELRYIVNGKVRWFDYLSRPELQPNGDILWDGIVRETTDHKRTEEALRESEAMFRGTFEQAAVGIAHIGLDGSCLRVNQRLCDIVGYSREEFMKLSLQDITYPADLATDLDYIQQMLEGKIQTHAMEKRYIRKDGSLIWINQTVSLARYIFGKPKHFISVIENISARKDSEKAQQAHIQLLTSMEMIDQVVRSATDLDQMMRDVLDAVLSIFDCDRAWLLYPGDPDSHYWRVPMQRTVPEYPLSDFLNSEMPMQPWIFRMLKKVTTSHGAVKLGPKEKTPVPSEGQDQFQIQSIIAMAVYPKGDKPWVFGLHQCSFARIWSADEKTLFQEIGRRIADSLTNLLAFRNLQKSEDRFRSLVENIPGFVYRSELKAPWRLHYVSESAFDLTGYSARQFLEAKEVNFGSLILAEDLAEVERIVAEGVSHGSHYEIEYRIRHASGEVRWVNEKGRASYDEDGVPLWLDGVITDITERKLTNETLKENEATLRSIYESSPMLMGVVELTEDDKIVHIYDNPATARFFNVEYKGTKNRAADQLGAPSEAIREWRAGYRQSQQQERPAQFEYVHPTPDGSRWLSATVSLIGPGNDGRTRFSYVADDITGRKRADEALRKSEAFLNAILDQSPFSTWISDDKGTLIRLNEACRNLMNITEEEVLGKYNVFQDNIVREQGFMPLVRRVFEAGEATGFELRYDSSQLSHLQLSGFVSVVVDITIFPIKDQNDKVTNAFFQQIDITAQRKAEDLLYENEERLRQAVRVSNIGIFDHDHLTDAYYCSPEHLKIYRLNETSTLTEFIDLTHPEDRDVIEAAVQRAYDPAGDGKFDTEFRLLLPGGEIRWVKIRSQTFFAGENSARHSIRTIGAVEDITEQKQAEIIMQEYADRQKVLLSEVNHRVKNNLAVIIGMLHKEEDLAKRKKQTSIFPLLHDLEGRLKGLLTVHSMLASSNWQPLLLSGLCKRIVSGIMEPHAADISIQISDSETVVESDQAHHLSLVINELATNSLKYALSEPIPTRINVDIQEKAGRIFLTFQDNGPGYPDNIINGKYAGTSLGFDLINGIVKKSLNGAISFRNKNGATTEISFDKSYKREVKS
jgi:PAS domain S-box-containing protein